MPMTQIPGRAYTPAAAGSTLGGGSTVNIWTLSVGNVGSSNVDFTVPAGLTTEVVDVILKKGAAGGAGDTHLIQRNGVALTNALATNVAAGVTVRQALLTAAQRQFSAGNTLRVVVNDGGAAATDCEIDVYWIKV